MTNPAAIPLDLLPPILQSIAQIIGIQLTMELVRHFGGVRIYIPTPERATENHPIAKIIGLDNLKALGAKLDKAGVEHFQLPKAERAIRAVRNALIVADSVCQSNRQIALKYQLTEDHVRRILTQSNAQDGIRQSQTALF